MSFSFDSIDFTSKINSKSENNTNDKDKKDKKDKYDSTTNETYRIKRLFKLDPITDLEIPKNLLFEFKSTWNPYNGKRGLDDEIGSLCFNAIGLYDYYFLNKTNGLWNPPTDQYQGYYGDLIGSGLNIEIKSRGSNPEKYHYRLPIIDCYLPPDHKFSVITMGPILTLEEISQIDRIILEHHKSRNLNNFITLSTLKYYYDNALNSSPDQELEEIIELKKKYPNLAQREINEKYNRFWVDKLVKIKY